MDKRLFWQKLKPLMFPIAFQNLMLSLVSTADALMMGMVDQSSLAAVSLATQVGFVLNLFLSGFTSGGSILAAQYWGKGSRPDVEQVFMIMLRPAVLAGGIFTAAALFVPETLMGIFTSDPELIRLGAAYLRWVGPSYLFMSISLCYMTIMRNSGRAGIASAVISAGVVVNIVLNAVLIFGLFGAPKMGAAGAAAATSITRAFELVCAWVDERRPDSIRLRLGQAFRKLPLSKSYWQQTLTVTCNFLVWGGGITMGSVILGRLGSDAVAANSIAVVMKNLIACFCMGLGAGGAILVGNELGSGQLDTAKAYGGRVVRLALLAGAVSASVMVALTPVILNLADLSPAAKEYLRWMILICAVNMIGMSNNSAIISGIFTAGGDTKFGFICDTITLWAVVVPLGLLAAFHWKLPVLMVYVIINMDEIVKLPAVFHHYRKYKWVRNLTVETKEL